MRASASSSYEMTRRMWASSSTTITRTGWSVCPVRKWGHTEDDGARVMGVADATSSGTEGVQVVVTVFIFNRPPVPAAHRNICNDATSET